MYFYVLVTSKFYFVLQLLLCRLNLFGAFLDNKAITIIRKSGLVISQHHRLYTTRCPLVLANSLSHEFGYLSS